VKKALLTILSVLLVDQLLKIWVKTNMVYNESISIFGDWFYIHFIENPGMAFGMQFGGDWGKLVLSVFRIAAVIGIGWYLNKQIKTKAPIGLIVSISLIFSGAIGNIIDSAFYGLIFNESTPWETASLFPANGGYGSFLHGKVVDMLYFPMMDGTFPNWLPIWGGEYFQFFRPVFNIADTAISTGVGMIIVFQKRYFLHEKLQKTSKEQQPSDLD
jgi:signal peptidase II